MQSSSSGYAPRTAVELLTSLAHLDLENVIEVSRLVPPHKHDKHTSAIGSRPRILALETPSSSHPPPSFQTTTRPTTTMSVLWYNRAVAALPKKKNKVGPKTGFLDLSAELRNRVYDLALVHNDEYDEGFINLEGIDKWSPPFDPPGLATNLLLVSRQIHHETAPVLYGANEFFLFFQEQRLEKWLACIGGNIAYLRKLRMRLPLEVVEKENRAAFRISLESCLIKLEKAPKLRVLKLHFRCHFTPAKLIKMMRVLQREMEEKFLPVPYTTDEGDDCEGYDHDIPLVSVEGFGFQMYERKLRSLGQDDSSMALSDEVDAKYINRYTHQSYGEFLEQELGDRADEGADVESDEE